MVTNSQGFYHCRTQIWIQVSEDATQPVLASHKVQCNNQFVYIFVHSKVKEGKAQLPRWHALIFKVGMRRLNHPKVQIISSYYVMCTGIVAANEGSNLQLQLVQ